VEQVEEKIFSEQVEEKIFSEKVSFELKMKQ